jgi:hypothetical protein
VQALRRQMEPDRLRRQVRPDPVILFTSLNGLKAASAARLQRLRNHAVFFQRMHALNNS